MNILRKLLASCGFSNLSYSLGVTLISVLITQLPVSCANSGVVFTALSPKVIRPHESYDLHISVEPMADNDQTPVAFEVNVTPEIEKPQPDFHNVWIQKKQRPMSPVALSLSPSGMPPPTNITVLPVFNKEVMVVPGISSIVKLSFQELKEERYNLTIKAMTSENKKVAEECASLHVDRKDEAAIIQTDKPIYKPGETVQFRVMFVDRHLKPAIPRIKDGISKFITVKVLDSQRNMIRLWKKVELEAAYGFVKKSVELSTEPHLGDWTIEVEVEAVESGSSRIVENYQHSFKVDQYVLPKFKVDIKPKPSFVTFEESKFTLVINSLYTYGKPVAGTCTVELRANGYEYVEYDVVDDNPSVDFSSNSMPAPPKPRRPKRVVKTLQIHGEGHLDFDLKSDLKIQSEEAYEYGKEYTIKASCLEAVSGKVMNASSTVKLYKYSYKISVIDPPSSYKPGFPLTMTIKISSQDDTPISDSRPDALRIEHGFSYDSVGGVVTKPVPPTGLVTVTFTTPTNEYIHISTFDVSYKNLTHSISVPSRRSSPTKTYMQLNAVMNTPVEMGEGGNSSQAMIKVGDTVPINVRMNKAFDNLHYIVAARGQILTKERVSFPSKTMEQIITLKVPPTIVPHVTLIVYTLLGPKNELIADDISLNVMTVMHNQLKISIGPQPEVTVGPGTKIVVACEGTPRSLIAVRAVDQSVLLLAEDKDVTKGSLKGIQDSFDQGIGHHRVYGGSEAFQIFDKTGIHMLTNGWMEKQQEYHPIYYSNRKHMAFKSAPMMMAMGAAPMAMRAESIMMDDAGSGSARGYFSEPVRVRSSFPETWIFKEMEALGDGKVELNEVVPDTITSFIINGFQINPETGIGLSDVPAKLTVFRPFFITLNLPYSIVQGEVVLLQVLVHNYMPEATKSKIILDNSRKELEILESHNTTETEVSKEIEVQGSSVSTVSFLVSAKKIGKITLDVKGLVMTAGDAVSQPLIVRPPGVKHIRNQVVFLNLVASGTITKVLEAIFPQRRVNGGDSLKVSVIGDVLGGTIHNLESLIQLPTGCGEQNMINFVPDIVVLDYLNITEELQPDVKAKALRYLETGYQRELTYRRFDGSFSAFGESDPGGSTWLTAFVVKSFISAKRYIWIDDVIIQSALEFLTQQQTGNGSFVEEGKIIHMGMQGASSNNRHALTAYCLIAFTEAQLAHVSDKFKPEVSKGIDFLLSEFDKGIISKNTYTVNLMGFLLHLTDHPRQNDVYKVMEDHAKFESQDELKYWLVSGERSPRSDGIDLSQKAFPFYWNPNEPHVRPASIEMTAYALMTQLIRDQRNNQAGGGVSKDSIAIARWLMKQRNENGGFLSTQDTVVGITALSQFAQAIKIPKDKYKMQVTSSWRNDQSKEPGTHDYFIGSDNTTVLQEYIMGNGIRKVNVTATGTGTALAQLTWTYHTLLSPNSLAFSLSVKVVGNDKNRRLDMNICTSYLSPDSSNMALLEVNTPTGYAFDSEELIEMKNKNPLIKRHELADRDTKLNIYFSSLQSTRVCLTLISYRVHLVAKHSKASVVVFDYYDTTKRAQQFYDAPKIDSCSICRSDATCKLNNCM